MEPRETEGLRVDSVDYRLNQFYDALLTSEDHEAESSIQSQLRTLSERYEFNEEIAVGGVKKIDRVLDRKTNAHVVMARPRDDQPERVFETFLREARLTAMLNHPNIITVHDIGIDEKQRPYFTMELKRGDSLSTIIRKLGEGDPDYRIRYSRETLLGIFVRLCDAVAYAHSEKVLHLDLKPANVQIGRFGGVQLCDWGLAKVLGTPPEMESRISEPSELQPNDTMDGRIKGTPGFMAPEQVLQQQPTRQTDIYSLGCILFSLLTFQEPLTGSVEEVMQKTQEGEVRSPMHAFPKLHVPESLDAVVMKAMAQYPAGRYASVEELQQEVQRYLAGYATSAENAGFRKLLRLLYRRNRTASWSIGTGLAVVVSGTTVFVRQLQQSEGRAVSQKLLADDARLDAEEKLQLYLEERERRNELDRVYTENVIDSTFEFIRRGLYFEPRTVYGHGQAIAHLDKVLERYPGNETALAHKGFLLFIMQRFNEAQACLEVSPGSHRYMIELCRTYGNKADADMLPPAEMAQLLFDIKSLKGETRLSLIEKLMSHNAGRRANLRQLGTPMEAMLQTWNPDWEDRNFRFDGKKRHLVLGGRGLNRLIIKPPQTQTSGECILRLVRPITLELRFADEFDLLQLAGLSVSTLDIRGTTVNDIKLTQKMGMLHELIVEPGRLTPAEKAKLSAHVSVTELPLPE
ncbi:Serine/threonine-protein kinase PknD [Pontiella desulfatans]|uniref:Serine/threonine-protein kinase PknD n=1 Tax=Pontiella desulfatans TaxID=2750659 RepID=A0A6C2U8Z3_PONDE|nr:serine/threonine-protein kinase [Pontiella desulfatans]VGO16313.1 Serine/threonine-protein kinase PknD [Pontiella desulfatans]